MRPSLRFSRPSASSNSPAATKSAGSFRDRSHLPSRESATVRVEPCSATGATSTAGRSSPRSRSPMSPQSAPATTGAAAAVTSSSPHIPASFSVCSGSSMASMKLSGGRGTFSKVVFSKICLTDLSRGQFPGSPALGRHSGTGGANNRALPGMCAETSVPSSCSSNFATYSVKLCALAVSAASGIWPISAMIFTRSSIAPSIKALLKRDMTSWRISAIFNIFFNLLMSPVMRYKNDSASKFLVFW
mmetsp:Transcript_21251/g.54259  ORF Transcript_21251/g.54259 Transcript_21251/m.54259 type:complete len:245 (-) Transcript_21251:1784-2518(-)